MCMESVGLLAGVLIFCGVIFFKKNILMALYFGGVDFALFLCCFLLTYLGTVFK